MRENPFHLGHNPKENQVILIFSKTVKAVSARKAKPALFLYLGGNFRGKRLDFLPL